MTFTISSVKNKLLVLFLLVAGLYIAKGFLIPMTIGGIFATLLLPMSKWMEKGGPQISVGVYLPINFIIRHCIYRHFIRISNIRFVR